MLAYALLSHFYPKRHQEPITQREGALNLCMYADSTCCQIALAQHSLYGKCKRYNLLSTSLVVNQPCIAARYSIYGVFL